MPDNPPRSQTQIDRRTDIAKAALRVLARGGHASLTARSVATEAGMSLGHITYNFDGMDEVLAEAYRLLSIQLQASSDASQIATTPEARLTTFLRAGFQDEILTPAHIRTRIDLWSAARAHPAVAETELQLYTHYRARLEVLLGPLVAAEAIPALTDMIMATLDGLWLDWMRRRDYGAIENGLSLIDALVSHQSRPPSP